MGDLEISEAFLNSGDSANGGEEFILRWDLVECIGGLITLGEGPIVNRKSPTFSFDFFLLERILSLFLRSSGLN